MLYFLNYYFKTVSKIRLASEIVIFKISSVLKILPAFEIKVLTVLKIISIFKISSVFEIINIAEILNIEIFVHTVIHDIQIFEGIRIALPRFMHTLERQ